MRVESCSRRDFLQRAGGVLLVGFSAGGRLAALPGQPAPPQDGRAAAAQLDSWIAVGGDGVVTAYTGKCELGQGLQTAQMQLIAEELAVSLHRVRLIQCDTALTPDQGTTSGSQSHPTNFNTRNLAQACATAREALVRLAAGRLAIPAGELTVSDGIVAAAHDSSRRVAYADLIGGRRFDIPLDPKARRRTAASWNVLGTSVPRVDLPAIVTGQLEYVHTLRVPGMLHGRVVRPPEVGATVVRVDEASIKDIEGLVKVVVRKDFVGVVAERQWQAIQAARRLTVTWSAGTGLPDQTRFEEYLRKQPARDTLSVDSADVDEKLAHAAAIVKATYVHPYQMHGSMGTSCAVADVSRDQATIWSSTQSVFGLRSTAASLLGLEPDRVRVIFTRGSGCYGINGADAVSYDAALLSQAAGRPVRVQLSRQDEMAWENYGFAYAIDQQAALDAAGTIVAWNYESWFASLGGRPGYDRPGNVVSGSLAGFEAAPFVPRSAPAPAGRFSNGSNAAPSYVAGCVGGACGGAGTVRSERVLSHTIRSPFFTGPLRSPSRLQNTFAHESFMDELAAHVKADPVAYRLRHLRDPRLKDVVMAAARTARWDARPSPRSEATGANGARSSKPAAAAGRGISCVLYEGDNGYCALVAEVTVDAASGRIAVSRFVAAQDCGPISTPDGMKNQIEGGILQGMSRALGEEVTWDEKKVTSVDWRSYHSLTLGFDLPVIDIALINRPDEEATGAGETAITLVAAAIGNAVFDATGVRLRQVPFTPDRLKAALG